MASTDETDISQTMANNTNSEKLAEVELEIQESNECESKDEMTALNDSEKTDTVKNVLDSDDLAVNGDERNSINVTKKQMSYKNDEVKNSESTNIQKNQENAGLDDTIKSVIKQVSEVDDAKDEETAIIDATNDLKILEKSKQISEGDAKSEQTSEGDVRYEKTSGEDVKNEKGSGGGVMSEQASGAGGDGDVTNKDAIDESDGEIVDSDDEEELKKDPIGVDYGGLEDVARPEFDQLDYDEDVDEGEIKDEPAEDKKTSAESKEMSDGEIASSDGEVKSDSENKDKDSMIQFKSDDYEEGEMIDAADRPPVPRETCRFFERGNCTWGDRCRFVHPGVNDRGSYRMFDDERRRPPFLGPPHMRFPPPLDPRGHPIPPHFPPAMMLGPPPPETAWERGLRHAKEMRRRSMQRKVEEPDFMRKREVLSLNEALNVDRDLDYIAQKPLADDESGGDPFATLEEDERFAVPSIEDVKKMKRLGKSHSRNDGRSNDGMRRQLSPRSHSSHLRREIDDRGRDRRSPPGHPGMVHDRHQPPPMPHHLPSHVHHEYRDRGGRHERDFRDRNMKERDYRMDPSRNYPPEDERDFSPRRRELESRVVAVDSSSKRKAHSGRGETWSDPWARGRQNVKKRPSRSDSESSGSSSSSSGSSFTSRSGSDSSRSSSRSSYSSSESSSGSSRSPSPQKTTKKVVKTKKAIAPKAITSKAKNSPKVSKSSSVSTKPTAGPKKTAELVKAKLTKPTVGKPAQKTATPAIKPTAKTKVAQRGRAPVKTVPKKKGKQATYDSSSSSEFSHSSSSESRSRSRSGDKESDSFSESESSSGSSSGSESFSSSSGSSSGSSDEEVTRKPNPAKKVASVKPVAPPAGEKKQMIKAAVPPKSGNKNPRTVMADKTSAAKPPVSVDSRKRSAAAMSSVPSKKGAAIASRRTELLEQLKVVENAIMKKRAKLT